MVNVLVVDDAETNIVGDAAMLERQGFCLMKAPKNGEVVAEVTARLPDVILLNVTLRGVSGIETCRRLKADRKVGAIPVILFTTQDDPMLTAISVDAGANQCISLPTTAEFLSQRLTSAMETIARGPESIAEASYPSAAAAGEPARRRPFALIANRQQRRPSETAWLSDDGFECRAINDAKQAEDRLGVGDYVRRLEDQVRHQTFAVRLAHEEIIERLVAASSSRDIETEAHIRRTGLLSGILARAAGWREADIDFIRLAAPMHDVGKVGIPDSILRKPSRLTPEEFETMKMHSTIGANMLAGSEFPLLRMAREIALSHHERFNGAGYPGGLAGDAIPESARIVAIVDAYDSLTHRRVYRPAMTEDTALCILSNGRGTEFDPGLLDLFFNLLDEVRKISRRHPDESLCDEQLIASVS